MKRARILTLTTSYADLFGALTPDKLDELGRMLSPDVVFTDPFNVIKGSGRFIAVFEHMFEVMLEPRFHIEDISASDRAGYIKWRMTGYLKKKPDFSIDIDALNLDETRFAVAEDSACNGTLALFRDDSDLNIAIKRAGFFLIGRADLDTAFCRDHRRRHHVHIRIYALHDTRDGGAVQRI